MSVLLQITNICKRYGMVTLLDNATASFSKTQKIGMIGRNGAGKSTLCKIIIGQEEADSGTISKNSQLRLSYLEQHDPYQPEETVIDFLMRYTGHEEWECGEMAHKFDLEYEILSRKITSLAGGYRTRVKLAAMLLRDPNFLILDEPTNYLDLSTLILLENFLQDFNGGFLIVSHDREFLKRTCDHTLEVESGRLTLYPGSIEEYFEFKEEQLANKIAFNKQVERKKEQLQEFVDRFKARASTATRAKSKMKQMSKLKTIEISHTLATVKIRIPPVEKKAGVALTVDELSIGYPDKIVGSGINLEVDRGARVSVLGNNGQGKTTFLRTIAGDLAAKSGSFKWGTGLNIGYYAQHVFSTLHPQDDIYSHLQRNAAEGVNNQDILDMAGCFLFKGDDVRKKVSVLSGGERARLCLAGLLLMKTHVLLLDEPTNHLDFETVEALANALKEYNGTLFFISHDRTFVNLIATIIIDVKEGKVKKYPGTYEDYVYHLESQARELFGHNLDNDDEDVSDEQKSDKKTQNQTNLPKAEKTKTKENKGELENLKKEIKALDSRMAHYNQEKERLLKEIQANPFNYKRERNDRLKELTALIETEEEKWLELNSKIESLQKASN